MGWLVILFYYSTYSAGVRDKEKTVSDRKEKKNNSKFTYKIPVLRIHLVGLICPTESTVGVGVR